MTSPIPSRLRRRNSLRLSLLAGAWLLTQGCSKPAEGEVGTTGEAGPAGERGAPGPQGPQGAQGPAGPAGAPGRGIAISVGRNFDAAPCTGHGTQVAYGYDVNGNGVLDPAELDPALTHQVCDGEQGAQGAQGPAGATGPQGPQGASGLIASRFVSWAGSRTISPDQSRFVDVVQLNGSEEGRVTTDRPARLMAHATVLLTPDLSKPGMAGEGRCGLFVPNGSPTSEENPEAGFDRMGNFMHFSYQSPTVANVHNNVSVPLVGALDRPAGTYDVVVKCQGLGQFNQLYTLWSADLAVTVAVK